MTSGAALKQTVAELIVAATTQKAKAPTGKKTPQFRQYDSVKSSEKLVNADPEKHYVVVPIDDPHVHGEYVSKGYEVEFYSETGVRFGGERVAPDMFAKAIQRRGCVLMSKNAKAKKAEDDEEMAEFNAQFEQLHKSKTGLQEKAKELGMRDEHGQAILSVTNQTSPLMRNSGV